MSAAPITAAQVRATEWVTLSQTRLERDGWGYLWESTTFPGLQKKVWRPSRRDYTRGALIVGVQHLGVFRLADDGTGFPDNVWDWAAELLNAKGSVEVAA